MDEDSIVREMETELDALIGKMEKVACLFERLQLDHALLKERLSDVEAERDRLRRNMDEARKRVETLIRRMPQEEIDK
jgi:predicted nuclease with TOPRIM domain